eukprot:2886340-Lingulodinium_polyedra.AAC.1
MMRSNRLSTTAAAHELQAFALHAHASFRCARGVSERAICEPLRQQTADSIASLEAFRVAFSARSA